MPNKVEKWEELSREIVFQKYSRKIEKVIYKMLDGKKTISILRKKDPLREFWH